MLNLYLAPRSGRAAVPEPMGVERALGLLTEEGIVGPRLAGGDYPPGPEAAWLFHVELRETLLPAELTFEALRVEQHAQPRFLPERQMAGNFRRVECMECGAAVDEDLLDDALQQLGFFPVRRFAYECPDCRTTLALKDLDFGQPTAIARFWFYVEGAASGRLNGSLLDRLERRLGVPLVVVPEVPEESLEDWVPARRRRPRR